MNCNKTVIICIIIIIIIFVGSNWVVYNCEFIPDKRYYVEESDHTKKLNIEELSKISKNYYNDKNNDKNIIIFISHDYQNFPEYGLYSRQLVQQYCKIHDYEFLDMDHKNQEQYSPYWLKIADLNILCENMPPNSIIMYLDIDAIITPSHFDVRLETILDKIDNSSNKKWDMYISIDPNIGNFEFNAGIIVVRNTTWTKNFLRLYLENYPKGFWTKNKSTHRWECLNCIRTCKECTWAGDEYEQGMLNRLYNRNVLDSQNHILPVSTHIFGNPSVDIDSYTIHLMSTHDDKRLSYFKQLYESLEKSYIF